MADVLDLPAFAGTRVVAGSEGLHRRVSQVNVMQLPTDRYTKPDELVLAAGDAFADRSTDVGALVAALAERGVAALAVRAPSLGEAVGVAALEAATRAGLPLLQLPIEAHLSELQVEVLSRVVTVQETLLKRTDQVRARLDEQALRGADLDEICAVLSDSIDADVEIRPAEDTGKARATDGDEGEGGAQDDPGAIPEPIDLGARVEWPIVTGRQRFGTLVARFHDVRDPVAMPALQHAATIMALRMLQIRQATEARARFRAAFLRDLLSGSLDAGTAMRRAEAVGWDPRQPFRVLAAHAGGDTASSFMSLAGEIVPGSVSSDTDGTFLALLPLAADVVNEPLQALFDALTERHPGVPVGVSALHAGLGDLPVAAREAREALQTARTFLGRTSVRRHEDLDLLLFLADVPRAELERFVADVLRPLAPLPSGYRERLLRTLDSLIACGLNLAETARTGGWHYNTVRSRVARLTDLLGPFLVDGDTLGALSVALVLKQELSPTPGLPSPW